MAAQVKEPYSKATTVDASQTTNFVPPQPCKIVTLVDSPKGPTYPVDCSGKQDFTDNFLGRSAVATDHTTILHALRLFNTARQTIVRVDGSKVLAGLDNEGSVVYTDTEGNVIENLTQADLTKIPDIKIIYIADGTNLYYVGATEDLDGRIPSKYSSLTPVQVSENPNLDELIAYLNSATLTAKFFGVNNLSNVELTDVADDVNGSTKLKMRGAFKRLRITNPLATLAEGNYITIGANDYYCFINGLSGDMDFNNEPVKINANDNQAPAMYQFLSYMYDELLNNMGISFRGTNMVISATAVAESTFAISDSFKNGLGASANVLKAVPCRKKLSGYIIHTVGANKTLYYVGDASVYAGAEYTGDPVLISSTPISPYKFITEFIKKLGENVTVEVTGQDWFFRKSDNVPLAIGDSIPSTVATIVSDTSSDIMYEYTFPTNEVFQNTKKYDTLSIKVDNFAFISGNYTPSGSETVIRIGGAAVTLNDFIEAFYKTVGNYFDVSLTEYGFIIKGNHTVTGCTNISVDVNAITQGFATRMAIVPRYSSKDNWIKYIVTESESDPEIFNLEIITTSGTDITYQFSFNSEKVDGNGISVYYKKLNADQKDFWLLSLNDSAQLDDYESRFFGADVTPPPASINDFISVIEGLKDIEDLYPNIIFDGGMMNAQIYQAISQATIDLNCNSYFSNPGKTEQEIADFNAAIGIDNFRCLSYYPSHLDSGVGSFSCEIGAATYVIEKIWNNVASVTNEFMPMVGKVKGVVTPGGVPVCSIDKPARERLLAKQINGIVWSEYREVWFLNNNLTMQLVNSQLSEEQSSRMAMISNQILQQYMDTQIGEFNTEDWRAKVVQECGILIDERLIKDHQYKMVDYVLICDETNNPVWLINQRKAKLEMKSQFQRSAIYMEVVNKIYGLESQIRTE